MKRLGEINNASQKSLIEVRGGAGTGKTILAVYLVKLLTDLNRNKNALDYIDNNENAEAIRHLVKTFGH